MKPWSRTARRRQAGLFLACFLLGLWLWACRPAATAPAVIATTTITQTSVMPRSSLEPTRGPAVITPLPTSTETTTLTATPLPPSPTPAPWLAAVQYEPWSLAHAVTWSADGRWLAAAAGEQIYIYDGASFQQVQRLDVGAWATGLAFAPIPVQGEQALLAAALRDGTLQLWDAAQGVRLAAHPAHPKGANSVAFSPDGQRLASTGNDALVRIWGVPLLLTGQVVEPLAVMIGGAVAVPAIRFSPDGSLVASIDLQVVRLRDSQTQRLVRSLHSQASMFALAFSPDGVWLAAGEMGGGVQVWDTASGEQVMLLEADAGNAAPARRFVWSLAFSADGRWLAAGSSGGTITVFEMPAGQVFQTWAAHSKAVSGLVFDPLGDRLASCGLDAALRVWQITH